MEELRAYLKTLAPPDQVAFAIRCGTTIGYLRKALSEGLTLREKLCAKLEAESAGAIHRQALRPTDWQEVWPELATPADAKTNHPPAPDQRAQEAIAVVAKESVNV